MPLPANQILHAEIVLTGTVAAAGVDSVNTNNVFTYKRIATTTAPSKNLVGVAFESQVLTAVKAMLNARWQGSFVRVRWLDDALDAYLDSEITGVGGVGGDSMGSSNCAYLLFRTGLRGKSFKGGKFFGPVSESDTTTQADIFNAAALTRLDSLRAACLAPLTDGGGNTWQPCIVSRVLSQLRFNPTILVSNPVTAVLINQRVSTLRGRKVKSRY